MIVVLLVAGLALAASAVALFWVMRGRRGRMRRRRRLRFEEALEITGPHAEETVAAEGAAASPGLLARLFGTVRLLLVSGFIGIALAASLWALGYLANQAISRFFAK